MDEFYNFGITLALADAGLTKTAGIGEIIGRVGARLGGLGSGVLRAIKAHPYATATALGLGTAGLGTQLLNQKLEEGDARARLLGGLAGGGLGAGLGALVGGPEHRGLGALIGSGLGVAGGAFTPELRDLVNPRPPSGW